MNVSIFLYEEKGMKKTIKEVGSEGLYKNNYLEKLKWKEKGTKECCRIMDQQMYQIKRHLLLNN